MTSRVRFDRVWALVLLLALATSGCGGGSGTSPAPQWKAGDVPAGQWGDQFITNLKVTSSGGELDSGCILALMTTAPVLDSLGRFTVAGTYHTDNTPPGITRPAQFIGAVTGTQMTLNITVNDGVNPPFTVGPYQLIFGRQNPPYTGTCP